MKKLYTILAALMFMCFLTTFSALMLNKTIDKAVTKANDILDVAAVDLTKTLTEVEEIEEAKFIHKAYFANCFPYVCAKGSFASLYLKTKEFSEQEQKEVVDELKLDLGTTSYFVVKYNPLTGKLFIDSNANNIILNENGEKLATIFFEKLDYEASADTIAYYKTVYDKNSSIEDVLSNLTGNAKFSVKNFKLSLDEHGFKADSIRFNANTSDSSDKITAKTHFEVYGSSTNTSDIKTDFVFDIVSKDISKEMVKKGLELAADYETAIETATAEDSIESVRKNGEFVIGYGRFLLDFVKSLQTSKSVILINNMDVKVYKDTAEKAERLVDVKAKLDFSLDDKTNPKGNLNVLVNTDDKKIEEVLKVSMFSLPLRDAKSTEMFEKTKDGYLFNIDAKDGILLVNSKSEIKVDGVLSNLLDMAGTLLSIAEAKLAQEIAQAQQQGTVVSSETQTLSTETSVETDNNQTDIK